MYSHKGARTAITDEHPLNCPGVVGEEWGHRVWWVIEAQNDLHINPVSPSYWNGAGLTIGTKGEEVKVHLVWFAINIGPCR